MLPLLLFKKSVYNKNRKKQPSFDAGGYGVEKIYKLCLLSAAVMTLFGGCGGNIGTESRSAQEITGASSAADEESPAQDSAGISFEAQDMEGNAVSSKIFSEARLTMVNVWATYCNPCLREMPGLGELANEYDAETFQIIGIISDVQEGADQKSVELAAGLIEQTGADYTHLLLNESLYYSLLTDVTAVPTTFFIDENGEILDTVIGSMEKSSWEEIIDAFLEEQ